MVSDLLRLILQEQEEVSKIRSKTKYMCLKHKDSSFVDLLPHFFLVVHIVSKKNWLAWTILF